MGNTTLYHFDFQKIDEDHIFFSVRKYQQSLSVNKQFSISIAAVKNATQLSSPSMVLVTPVQAFSVSNTHSPEKRAESYPCGQFHVLVSESPEI